MMIPRCYSLFKPAAGADKLKSSVTATYLHEPEILFSSSSLSLSRILTKLRMIRLTRIKAIDFGFVVFREGAWCRCHAESRLSDAVIQRTRQLRRVPSRSTISRSPRCLEEPAKLNCCRPNRFQLVLRKRACMLRLA